MDKFYFSDASWQVSLLAVTIMSACNKVHHGVWLYCASEHMLDYNAWSHVSAMRYL